MQSSLSGSYKYSFGFLEQLKCFFFFFFLSWNRAGWAPGDISPRSVVSFLLGVHSKEGEQSTWQGEVVGGCCCSMYKREGENSVQPFLCAFPASLVIPRRSILRVTPSFEIFCKPSVTSFWVGFFFLWFKCAFQRDLTFVI